eukprot:jgi/Tetstr1/465041/TSEL_009769.t1
MVLYELAKTIDDLGYDVAIFNVKGPAKNPIFNKYVSAKDVGPGACVVYPEVTRGNPLGARRAVRWILMDPDRRGRSTARTWGRSDRVVYFSSYNPGVSVTAENTLFVLNINPKLRVIDEDGARPKSAYCDRKASLFHDAVPRDHPEGAIRIHAQGHDELVEIFNQCSYFHCYDPYTYIAFMAAMCGCVAIVTPVRGLSKQAWIDTLYCKAYFRFSPGAGADPVDLCGIAYGSDPQEIARAEATVKGARKQQLAMQEFGAATCKAFCESMTKS